MVTQEKSQLKQELLCKQHEQDTREDELIATHNREMGKIWARVKKEIDEIRTKAEKGTNEMTLQFQEDAAKWKEKLADKQEDQWAILHEKHDTTLREVLTQMEAADSMKLLSWFFSTSDNPGAAPTCPMGEVLAAAMQPRVEAFADITPWLKSSHSPHSVASPVPTSSPAPQAHTPPPLALPISDIEASSTPVRFSPLTLIVGTKPKKQDWAFNSVFDDQCDKRACIRIKKDYIDDGGHRSNVNAR